MAEASCTVVVGFPADALAGAVAAALRGRGIDVISTGPSDLADLSVSLSEETFAVEGRSVGAIVFRAPPDMSFSRGFHMEDRSFCDTETRALWLAASHLTSVLAVNRYGPGPWFGETAWTHWRPLFQEAGLPLAPFAFGNVPGKEQCYWYPYSGQAARTAPGRSTRRTLGTPLTSSEQAQVSLVVGDDVVEGDALPVVRKAMALLRETGVHIASIATDAKGRVLLVDTLPVVNHPTSVRHSAHLISELCYAHMCRR